MASTRRFIRSKDLVTPNRKGIDARERLNSQTEEEK